MTNRDEIARTLYECEKRRAENCQSILQKVSGKECPGAAMEPWDECKDVFLSDADAVLSLAIRPDLDTIDAIISDNVYVDNDGVAGISSAAEAILAAFPSSRVGSQHKTEGGR